MKKTILFILILLLFFSCSNDLTSPDISEKALNITTPYNGQKFFIEDSITISIKERLQEKQLLFVDIYLNQKKPHHYLKKSYLYHQ